MVLSYTNILSSSTFSSKTHPYLKQWSKRCSHLTVSQVRQYLVHVLSPISDQLESLLISESLTTTNHQGLPLQACIRQMAENNIAVTRDLPLFSESVSCSTSSTSTSEHTVVSKIMALSAQTSMNADSTKAKFICPSPSSPSPSPHAHFSSLIVSSETSLASPTDTDPLIKCIPSPVDDSNPASPPPPPPRPPTPTATSSGNDINLSEPAVLMLLKKPPHSPTPDNSEKERQSKSMQIFLDKLAASLQHAETGNWLHRLLLLDHIDEVQKKILNWIEDVDKKIDGELTRNVSCHLIMHAAATLIELFV